MDNPRPDSITLLGTFEVLIALLAGLGALVVALLNAILSLAFAIFCSFGLVWLISGLGFLNGKHWAWSWGMASAILSLLASFLLSLFFVLRFLFGPGLICWPIAIYILNRPQARSYFGRSISATKPARASGGAKE